jgi:hypothetical protein
MRTCCMLACLQDAMKHNCQLARVSATWRTVTVRPPLLLLASQETAQAYHLLQLPGTRS